MSNIPCTFTFCLTHSVPRHPHVDAEESHPPGEVPALLRASQGWMRQLKTCLSLLFLACILGFVQLISGSQESKTMGRLMSVRYLQAEAAEVPFAGSNSINAPPCWSAASPLFRCLTLLSTHSALTAVLPDTATHERLHDDFICLPVYYPLGNELRLVNVFSYKCSNPDI